MSENSPESMNPNALSLEDAARLLTKVGGREISVEMLRSDVLAGAPTNPDGTINLVHYTAWNIKELGNRSDGH
jgi:hypothetical protein